MRVSDTGRGMTREEQEHIFDRFYRGADGANGARAPASASRSSSRSSTCTAARSTVESEPDKGTLFTVRIPRQPLAEGGPLPREALRGRRVLVVDDEPDIAELIAEHLEPYEVETTIAHSGAEALEHLRARALRRDDARHPDAGHERLRGARGGARRPRAAPHVGRVRLGLLRARGARRRVDGGQADRRRGAGRRARLGRARRPHARAGGRAATSVKPRLEPALERLGIEHEWATSGASRRAHVPGAPLRGRARRRGHAQPADGDPARSTCAAGACGGRCSLFTDGRRARRASWPPSRPSPCRSRRPPTAVLQVLSRRGRRDKLSGRVRRRDQLARGPS